MTDVGGGYGYLILYVDLLSVRYGVVFSYLVLYYGSLR
jgi:hypothetical protein